MVRSNRSPIQFSVPNANVRCCLRTSPHSERMRRSSPMSTRSNGAGRLRHFRNGHSGWTTSAFKLALKKQSRRCGAEPVRAPTLLQWQIEVGHELVRFGVHRSIPIHLIAHSLAKLLLILLQRLVLQLTPGLAESLVRTEVRGVGVAAGGNCQLGQPARE